MILADCTSRQRQLIWEHATANEVLHRRYMGAWELRRIGDDYLKDYTYAQDAALALATGLIASLRKAYNLGL